MEALSNIKSMGLLKNCMIVTLNLKLVGGESNKVKLRGISAIFTGRCSCTVIC